MSKQFNIFLLKILTLSIFFVIVFNIGYNLINANSVEIKKEIRTSNNSNFKKINNSTIGKTGVAISTNIGIRHKQREESSATIYKEIFSISEILSNPDLANKELIGKNMIVTEEYKNVLQTNVKQLLDSSYDKPRFLNAYIEQLEFRYVLGIKNIKQLNEQKNIFTKNMNTTNNNIEELKKKIDIDFSSNNSAGTLENINKYLELKKEFYYSRTYIVYINHFINEYNILNNYNKILLDTLINNKEALIKDAFVVIPDSGAELLKSFNLLYSEDELK